MKSDHKWLLEWSAYIENKNVLELGCGDGADARTVLDIAKNYIACDLNPPENIEGVSALLKLDHSLPLPFRESTIDIVVASLSLHYFDWNKSERIIAEVSRILGGDGKLICRLNSTLDKNWGAIGYPEIEQGLYDVDGIRKRFFSKEDVYKLIKRPFEIVSLKHREIDRYPMTKSVWEVCARNA